ncbi:hypothetical protein OOK41_15855 [Micromonospora sp. NBC_01655]|uniref:YunG family protein n=1 Tax=Micromonospora sp. NBC_01655 TaxID=2975983 RepID=UPI002259498A|nr:hypothetical protein [Micromonospora sp. NBC_01655]MCX4471762.1 hypothetical protein [Micromonospora sp. NBC_01655]
MLLTSLAEIEGAIRAAWSPDTCDPVDLPHWSSANPARGQCGVTALLVRELLGGELLLGTVLRRDGTRQGVHYWNRLGGGVEVDLTREQFTSDEVVQAPVVVDPPPGPPERLRDQHLLLRRRVLDSLDITQPSQSPVPATAQTRRGR